MRAFTFLENLAAMEHCGLVRTNPIVLCCSARSRLGVVRAISEHVSLHAIPPVKYITKRLPRAMDIKERLVKAAPEQKQLLAEIARTEHAETTLHEARKEMEHTRARLNHDKQSLAGLEKTLKEFSTFHGKMEGSVMRCGPRSGSCAVHNHCIRSRTQLTQPSGSAGA